MAATYGRPGEVRQGGGKEGLSASVCLGDTIRQNDINTFIKALGAKASVKFGPTGVNSFREKVHSNRTYVCFICIQEIAFENGLALPSGLVFDNIW